VSFVAFTLGGPMFRPAFGFFMGSSVIAQGQCRSAAWLVLFPDWTYAAACADAAPPLFDIVNLFRVPVAALRSFSEESRAETGEEQEENRKITGHDSCFSPVFQEYGSGVFRCLERDDLRFGHGRR
jgi:hypothetical protein